MNSKDGRFHPHLTPSLIHSITQLDHLLQIADIRRDGKHICFPCYSSQFFAKSCQAFCNDVSNGYFQAQTSSSISLVQFSVEDDKDSYVANSFAAALPMPQAAPV